MRKLMTYEEITKRQRQISILILIDKLTKDVREHSEEMTKEVLKSVNDV